METIDLLAPHLGPHLSKLNDDTTLKLLDWFDQVTNWSIVMFIRLQRSPSAS